MPAAAPASALPAPRQRSRSRGQAAVAEGRRYSRAEIESRFLRQWRGLAPGERPLPGPGRRDSGVVGDGAWRSGLEGAALERTRDLLRSERWRAGGEVESVHLTMYLRWAAAELQRRDGERLAGLELGRHIAGWL